MKNSYCLGQREQRKTNTSQYYDYSRESPFIISEKRGNLRTLVRKSLEAGSIEIKIRIYGFSQRILVINQKLLPSRSH